jgi:hypothetical protein
MEWWNRLATEEAVKEMPALKRLHVGFLWYLPILFHVFMEHVTVVYATR